MKVLVISGDIYHHSDVVKQALGQIDNVEFVYENYITKLDSFDCVIIAKDNYVSMTDTNTWLTPDVVNQIDEFVSSGKKLIVLHAGTVLCKHSEKLKHIVGCEFLYHPEQCKIDFVDNNNCILFSLVDEHYFIDFVEQNADIFLYSVSNNGKQVAGYSKTHGKGKVLVLTQGHNEFSQQTLGTVKDFIFS